MWTPSSRVSLQGPKGLYTYLHVIANSAVYIGNYPLIDAIAHAISIVAGSHGTDTGYV